MERAMDGIPFEIPLFLFATFAGAFVAGLSGFAFGLVAASLRLYFLTPVQSATLIVAFGLIVQAVWKLREALERKALAVQCRRSDWRARGCYVLTWSYPRSVRIAVGIILVL